jgi:dTDP-4-amino-4,6-dideoxygalactose transaminase
MKIPVVSLQLPDEVIAQTADVLRSGQWVDGSQVKQLQTDFAKYCGVSHCRAVSNGTTALMTIIGAAGLAPGDEVIVPSFSFIATANCVKSVGAKPVFADISAETFTLDPKDVLQKITPKTKAIMPVHLYGLCADMDPILQICNEYNLLLLEDAAQAHGAKYKGKSAGSFGWAAGFSLYPTKNMFAGGEGGLITTNSADTFEKVSLYMNHGQAKRYYHTTIGYNFRMAEINAVVAQYALRMLDTWNAQRRMNAKILSDLLSKNSKITVPSVPKYAEHVFHQYTIRIPNRDKVAAALQAADIGFGIHYGVAIHQQPVYANECKNLVLPETEKAVKEVLSLPIHPAVTEEQLHEIANVIIKALS